MAGTVLFNGRRSDVVDQVVFLLDPTPAVALIDGPFHGTGDTVGIKDDRPVHVPGRSAAGLDKGSFRSKESLFVRIEDGYE